MCKHQKDTNQLVQRLKAEGLVIGDTPTKKHRKLTLANGQLYVCATTPTDWRGLKNMEARIRRMCEKSLTQD